MLPLAFLLSSVLAGVASAAAVAPALTASPDFASCARCSYVTFNVPASAENVKYDNLPDPNNQTAVTAWLYAALEGQITGSGNLSVSGTYSIAGYYCSPTGFDRGKLQLLVHGATYNKTMWAGLGYGDQYNWHAFGTQQGYHTLAIDRLGHGSSEPTIDPFNINQVPLQLAIYHSLIQILKAGGARSPLRQAFSEIAWIGHSYGSLFGSAMALQYPGDFQAVVLTGYSNALNTSSLFAVPFVSVSTVFPTRYSGFPFGYFTTSTEAGRQAAFYFGDFDERVAQGDFLFADDVSAGEMSTFGLSIITTAPTYNGAVMVVTAQDDSIFCNTPGESCASILANTASQFPNAATYGTFIPPDTGHCLTLHRTNPLSAVAVNGWLNQHFH